MKTTHEKIMKRAYTKWNTKKGKNWTLRDFVDHLDYQEHVAVALGNMHYQIGNGGIGQWIYNGYYERDAGFISNLLRKAKGKLAGEILRIIESIDYPILGAGESLESHNKYGELDNKYFSLPEKEVLRLFNNIVKQAGNN